MSELDKLYGYLFDVNTYIERMTGVEGYEPPVAKLIEVRDSVLKFISKVEEKDPMFFAGDGSNYFNSIEEACERLGEEERPPVDPDDVLFEQLSNQEVETDDEEYPFIQEQE